jgi:RHS repeat-associated protein
MRIHALLATFLQSTLAAIPVLGQWCPPYQCVSPCSQGSPCCFTPINCPGHCTPITGHDPGYNPCSVLEPGPDQNIYLGDPILRGPYNWSDRDWCEGCGVQDALEGMKTWYDVGANLRTQCYEPCGEFAEGLVVIASGVGRYSLDQYEMDCGNLAADYGGWCLIDRQKGKVRHRELSVKGGSGLCPDGESTTVVGCVGVGRPIKWSLRDNEEGCSIRELCYDNINGYQIEIKAGKKRGNGRVVVEARDCFVPNLKGKFILPIGCGGGSCEAGNCSSAGSGRVQNGSVELEISLGSNSSGEAAGYLVLLGDLPGEMLVRPEGLSITSLKDYRSSALETVSESSSLPAGVIRQFVAPNVVADVVWLCPQNETYGYQVNVYDKRDMSDGSGNWLPLGNAKPLAEWRISAPGAQFDDCEPTGSLPDPLPSPEPEAFDVIEIVEARRTSAGTALINQNKWTYQRIQDLVGEGWALTHVQLHPVGETPLERVVTQDLASPPLLRFETTERYVNGEWQFAGRTEEWLGDAVEYGCEPVPGCSVSCPPADEACKGPLVKHVVYSDSLNTIETEYEYFKPSDGPLYDPTIPHRPKWEKSTTGAWVWYDYPAPSTAPASGEFIEVEVEVRPWLDEPFPSTCPSYNGSGFVSQFRETTRDADSRRPKKIDLSEWVDGTLASRTIRTYTYTGSASNPKLTLVEQRCSDASCSTAAVTTTQYDGDTADSDVLSVSYPDQRRDVHTYSEVASFGTEYPSTSGPYRLHQTTRYSAVTGSAQPTCIDGETTIEEELTDPAGRRLLARTWLATDTVCTPANSILAHRRSWTYDGSGKVLTERENGILTREYVYDDCCHVVKVTSLDGTTARTTTDALGRVREQFQEGAPASGTFDEQPDLTTEFEDLYDAVRGLHGTRRTVSDGTSEWVLAEEYSDWLGRSVSSVDQNGLTTTWDYTDGPTGTAVAEEGPNGVTTTTSYYADGQLKSRTGDAITAEHHTYGMDSGTGESISTIYYGAANSPRFSSVRRDRLGRTTLEERPAFSSTPQTLSTVYTYYPFAASSVANQGRLRKVVEPGQTAARLYEYDVWGEVSRTALDLNGNDVVEDQCVDRITEHARKWRENTTRQWDVVTVGLLSNQCIGRETVQRNGDLSLVEGATAVREGTFAERLIGGPDTSKRTVTTTYDRDDKLVIQKTEISEVTGGGGRVSETITYNGRLQQELRPSGEIVQYKYDAFGRRTAVFQSRIGLPPSGAAVQVITYHPGTSQVNEQKALRTGTTYDTTTFAYYPNGVFGAGQVSVETNPDNKATRFEYTARGDVRRIWGDVPQPVQFDYDVQENGSASALAFGVQNRMTTYQANTDWSGTTWPTSPPAGQTTHWSFDDATGLLLGKKDAAGKSVLYDYYPNGRLETRTWARPESPATPLVPLVTTYDYHAATGELKSIDYSNTTDPPDLSFTYTVGGRLSAVDDRRAVDAIDIAYEYNERFEKVADKFTGDVLQNRTVRRQFHAGVPNRLTNVQVFSGPTSEYSVTYEYGDSVNSAPTGRMTRAYGTGLPAGTSSNRGVRYTYYASSDHVEKVSYVNDSNQTQFETTRALEASRNLLASVENRWMASTPASTISKFTYTNDALGRRTSQLFEGTAFAGAGGTHWNRYGYNARNELIDSEQYTGTTVDTNFGSTPSDPAAVPATPSDPPTFAEYDYDGIGNRSEIRQEQNPEIPLTYFSNALNQYSSNLNNFASATSNYGNQFTYDADGNLTKIELTGDANCDGSVGLSDNAAFVLALTDPNQYAIDHPNCPISNCDTDGNGQVGLYDISRFVGLLTSGGNVAGPALTYTWDQENRLVAVEPTYLTFPTSAGVAKRVQHSYDYMGRRVRTWTQTVYHNGTSWFWSTDSDTRYVWDGWLLLEELDGTSSVLPPKRKYTWGLDLAGLNGQPNDRSSAGGIGGLLAMEDHDTATPESGSFWYTFDGNGNVSELVEASTGNVAVHYEYDAYGQSKLTTGLHQPFRFSTKMLDAVSGLYYYGYRWYSPGLGRWISRDPLEESGGIGLFVAMGNDLIKRYDPLGLLPPFPGYPGGIVPNRTPMAYIARYVDECSAVLKDACRKHCSPRECFSAAEHFCDRYVREFSSWRESHSGEQSCMELANAIWRLNLGNDNEWFYVMEAGVGETHVIAGAYHVCNPGIEPDGRLDPWDWFDQNWFGGYQYDPETLRPDVCNPVTHTLTGPR